MKVELDDVNLQLGINSTVSIFKLYYVVEWLSPTTLKWEHQFKNSSEKEALLYLNKVRKRMPESKFRLITVKVNINCETILHR